MPQKDSKSLRSYRWYGPDDLRSFGHRSRAASMGCVQADYAGKPVIAIINTWSDINPCHSHLRERANDVKRGIWQAGGFPVEMPAISLGETFQKPTTMMYRNLLAMETEELLRSYPADGCVLLGGCDKTTPALLMGAISMNIPAIYVPAGPMLRGNWHGQILGSGSDVTKYWNERRAGNIDLQAWTQIEDGIARSAGTCMTMGTASTMTSLTEVLGFSLPGASSIPAVDSNHVKMANRSGRRIVEMVWEDLKPRDILNDASFNNAIASVFALGGSTNAVIHLVALAGRAGIKITLDRFDQLSRKTPLLANLRPSGKYLMEDFYYAGGLPALLKAGASQLDLSCLTITGKTLGGERCGRGNLQHRCDSHLGESCSRIRRAGDPARKSGADRRRHQGLSGRTQAPETHRTRHRVRQLRRDERADRRSGSGCGRKQCSGAAQRRPQGSARHARMGQSSDPAKAAKSRNPRHGAHLRRKNEWHQLRRLCPPCFTRVVCRRATGAAEGRGHRRTRCAGTPIEYAGE